MALQITEFKGIFSVNGSLDSTNVRIFEKHMENFIKRGATVVLDLKCVSKIDELASRALIQMFAHALLLDCQFTINGWLPIEVLNQQCLKSKI